MQETKTGKTGPLATNIMCHLGKAQQGRGTRRTARENEPPFFWDAGCKKPKREQGGPPVLHTCSQPTLRTSRLLRNSIILLPMVVAVQAKRNMLWFQKRNFEFRNNLTSRRVGHHIMCHLGKAQQGRGTRPPRKELGPGETCAFNVRL